jgi:transposase-like protein
MCDSGDTLVVWKRQHGGREIDAEWPYRWLDFTYLKVRDGGRTVSVAAIIAVAVNTEGRAA